MLFRKGGCPSAEDEIVVPTFAVQAAERTKQKQGQKQPLQSAPATSATHLETAAVGALTHFLPSNHVVEWTRGARHNTTSSKHYKTLFRLKRVRASIAGVEAPHTGLSGFRWSASACVSRSGSMGPAGACPVGLRGHSLRSIAAACECSSAFVHKTLAQGPRSEAPTPTP